MCKIVLANNKRISALEASHETRKATALKEINRRIRRKYEMRALVAKGEFTHAGKDRDGEDKFVVSYENDEVGILPLSQKQKEDFLSLLNQKTKYPYMNKPEDLFNRTIVFLKKKKTNPDTGDEYFVYEIIPGKKPHPRPKVTVEKGKFKISEAFEPDEEALAKMAKSILSGGGKKKHEVEYENDDEEETVDEEDLEEEESEEEEDETPRRRSHEGRKKVSHDDEDTEDDGGGGSDEDESESDDVDSEDEEESDEFEDSDSSDDEDSDEEEAPTSKKRVKGKKKDGFDDSFMEDLDESEGPDEIEEFEDDNPEEDEAPRHKKTARKPAAKKTARSAPKKRPRR